MFDLSLSTYLLVDPRALRPQQPEVRRAATAQSVQLAAFDSVFIPDDHLRQHCLDGRVVANEGNVGQVRAPMDNWHILGGCWVRLAEEDGALPAALECADRRFVPVHAQGSLPSGDLRMAIIAPLPRREGLRGGFRTTHKGTNRSANIGARSHGAYGPGGNLAKN